MFRIGSYRSYFTEKYCVFTPLQDFQPKNLYVLAPKKTKTTSIISSMYVLVCLKGLKIIKGVYHKSKQHYELNAYKNL